MSQYNSKSDVLLSFGFVNEQPQKDEESAEYCSTEKPYTSSHMMV
jgi:hypothetical protein